MRGRREKVQIHGEVHLRDLRLEEVKGEQDLRLLHLRR